MRQPHFLVGYTMMIAALFHTIGWMNRDVGYSIGFAFWFFVVLCGGALMIFAMGAKKP